MEVNNIKIQSKLYNLIGYIKMDIEEGQKNIEFWKQLCDEEGADTVIKIDGKTYGQKLQRVANRVDHLKKELIEVEKMINRLN